jgi:hypothetical protein
MFLQILSISCDNASPNDTMMDALTELLKKFPGESNRIRCFLHILNLVAKSLIRQFDIPKAGADAALDEAEAELFSLAGTLEDEELEAQACADNDEENDNDEGWVDEVEQMLPVDREELDQSVRPIKLVLVKVSTVE